jgi:hypothetical protein
MKKTGEVEDYYSIFLDFDRKLLEGLTERVREFRQLSWRVASRCDNAP